MLHRPAPLEHEANLRHLPSRERPALLARWLLAPWVRPDLKACLKLVSEARQVQLVLQGSLTRAALALEVSRDIWEFLEFRLWAP